MNPSRLESNHQTLILDASVLINLLGTGQPGVILSALERTVMVDELVIREVAIDPCTRKPSTDVLKKLEDSQLIRVVKMDAEAYDIFLSLTGADPPDDLDDGEAATLAQVFQNGGCAVIDEKKATRVGVMHRPGVLLLDSIDLLASPDVVSRLGLPMVAEAVYLALWNARMRVSPQKRAWVAETIGEARAIECASLGAVLRV